MVTCARRLRTRNSDDLWQMAFDFITLKSRSGQAVHQALIWFIEFGIGHVIGNVIGAGKRGFFTGF